MNKETYSMAYKDGIIIAESKKALLESVELEILKDPETRFLHKEATEEYLKQLIKKHGFESMHVKFLKQRIKESFKEKQNG